MVYPICVNDLIKHYIHKYTYIYIHTSQYIFNISIGIAQKVLLSIHAVRTSINTYTQIFNGMIRKDHY